MSECKAKTCTRCEHEKPVDEFYTLKAGRCGRQSWCKGCLKEHSRLRRHTWPSKRPEATRARHLKRRYGLSVADVAALSDKQDGVCAICGGDWQAVDHDHVTGEVRGLLCHACNTAIGSMRDNPTRLRTAAGYLEHPPGRV